jgi:hypothetical protein
VSHKLIIHTLWCFVMEVGGSCKYYFSHLLPLSQITIQFLLFRYIAFAIHTSRSKSKSSVFGKAKMNGNLGVGTEGVYFNQIRATNTQWYSVS